MNFRCAYCDESATKVCIHPDCECNPFVCGGLCANSVWKLVHTHNKENNFISTDKYYICIEQYKNMLNPEIYYQKYFNYVKKNAQKIKDNLTQVIKNIDITVKQYIGDLTKYLKLNNNGASQHLINKILEATNGQKIEGKQIRLLVNKQKIFKKQKLLAFETIKQQFDKRMNSLKLNDPFKNFVLFDQRKQKNSLLNQQGIKLIDFQKYEQSLLKFNQAKKLYDFNLDIHWYSGISFKRLNKPYQSIKQFQQCLKINPQLYCSHIQIAKINQQNKKYQQAIKHYSEGFILNINRLNSINQSEAFKNKFSTYYQSRGKCYQNINKLKEAIQDYKKAISLNPREAKKIQLCIKQIQEQIVK